MLFMKTRQLVLPEHNIISLYPVCVCVHVWADIHEPVLSTEVLRGCGQQKLVPLESPLLAVNDTNRDFVSSLSSFLLHHSLLSILTFSSSLSSLTHLLICSPSISLSFSCLCLLFPIYLSSSSSFPSPLLARWLVYHWDGCRIKATLFFFFLPPSLLLCLSPQSNFSVFPLRGL